MSLETSTRAVWAFLAAAAALYLGYHAAIGLGLDDTNHLETTLAMVVARQLHDGPSTLYGPVTGTMPLALIHAPLYYRLAAPGAWTLAALGFDPPTAGLYSGRALSMLGMLATMAGASHLARLDGAPRRAGWWSALLLAAAPVFGSFPATVRPDTLAIAFQTWGVALAWGWLRTPGSRPRTLLLAYAALGLAACTKQNFVVSAAITSAILLVQAFRGNARARPIVAAHALGLGIVLGYYGREEFVTGGAMSHAVFALPSAFGRVNGATWGHVATVFLEAAKESIGLLALAFAAMIARAGRRAGAQLDAGLAGLLAGETAAMAFLSHGSTGSWVNYAMPPVLYAAILVGRALDRALAAGRPAWRIAPILAACLLLVLADGRYVAISARSRMEERARLRVMFADPRVSQQGPEARYFVARPQYNRLYGRPDLIHDDWLYGAFEAQSAAEPRSNWLRWALVSGPVRQVIVGLERNRDPNFVEGLADPLERLGYRQIAHFDGYDVWERQ